ncbi:hypothetical protein ACWPKS_06675 [Coraliomargarita sp. W4R72]
MHFNRPKTKAFTLAEVVVGVLLLGLTAAVLGQAVSNALRAYTQTQLTNPYEYPVKRVRDHVLQLRTRALVEEGGELEIPITHGTQREGDTQETTTIRARWEAEVHSTRILNVYQVELSVDFQGGSEQALKTESKIITYRTTWSDPDEFEQLIEAKEEEFKDRQSARGEIVEDDA